ncbi:MAG: hypothetical protein M3Q78_00775 [Acidobacteriota bacterium]|nr:hypothetical protein [Acidobacteriota bacterium]
MFENSNFIVFVIEDDQYYSVARIATWLMKSPSVAEGDEHITFDCSTPSASGWLF